MVLKLDLVSYEVERIPLTIPLKLGEVLLLFPDNGEMTDKKVLQKYILQFDKAEVCFEENYLPLEMVCYSNDGVNYSEPIPYRKLFNMLLEERYEGRIFFCYNFEVREIPETILLRAEECNTKCKIK